MANSSSFAAKTKIGGHCIAGRLVRLRFKDRKTKQVRESNVIYPWTWTKSNVLASARDAHPDTTVCLVEWTPYSADGGFEPSFWIANPQKILEYSRQGKP